MAIETTDHITYGDLKTNKGFKINGYDIEVNPDNSTIIFDPTGKLKTETQNLTKASTTLFGVAKIGSNLDVTSGVVRVADAFVTRVGNLETGKEDKVTGGFLKNRGTEIPQGANLFLYTTPGRYYCYSAFVASTLLGIAPFGGTKAFVLEVKSVSPTITSPIENVFVTQEVISQDGEIEIRRKAGVLFNDWKRTATENYVDSADNLLQANLNTTNANVTNLTTRTTNLEDTRVLRSGDTMTGGLTIDAGGANLTINGKSGMDTSYILSKNAAGQNSWFMGTGTAGDPSVAISSYIHGTQLVLSSDKVYFNKDAYVGTDRLVKLTEHNLKANKSGDTFTGNVLIKHSAPILSLDTTIANGSNYLQGRASDNTVIWNLGNATSTNNLVINSVKNNTALSFKSDRLESNRDVYVGTDRLVKLPELTATNTNVTNLTTRTTNLENSRALQTSLDTTNNRVTTLERFTGAATVNSMAGILTSNVYRSGNSVFWFFDTGTALNGSKTQGEVIATIPAGFRPATTYYLALANYTSGATTNVIVQVSPNGEIAIANPKTNTTTGGFRGTLSFPAQ